MTIKRIPLAGSADAPTVRQRVNLDGLDFIIELQWNGRMGRWFLHLFDAAASPIALGLMLAANSRIGHRSTDSRMPPGLLFLEDPADTGRDPGIENLGDYSLVYVEAANLSTVAEPVYLGAPA